MLDRQRPIVRTTLTRLAIGGAAGIATLLAAAPGALATTADDVAPDATTEATPTPESTPAPASTPEAPDAPAASSTPTTTPAPEALEAPDVARAPKAAIEPDFGYQKFRIGVKIADGSYAPAGTTTVGSTFTVTETGPNVDDDENPETVATRTFTCTTSADTADDDGATFCDTGNGGLSLLRGSAARSDTAAAAAPATRGVTVTSTAGLPSFSELYEARPGSTVTIRQTAPATGLVRTDAVATIPPCVVDADAPSRSCAGDSITGSRISTALFSNTGLPPVAVDDTASTRQGTPVTIDVLGNDDTGYANRAPLTSVTTVRAPADGSVTVTGEVAPTPTPTPTPSEGGPIEPEPTITASSASRASVRAAATGPSITYTPRSGFAGRDTFTYSLATPNGTATATVTVTVAGDATPTPDDGTGSDGDDGGTGGDDSGGSGDSGTTDDDALPDAGGFDRSTLVHGVALLTAGGVVTVAAGRRQRARHADAG